MSESQRNTINREHSVTLWSGWPMLFLLIAAVLACIASIVFACIYLANKGSVPVGMMRLLPSIFALAVVIICFFGLFTLQPNQARVLVLFGRYKGTVRKSGFFWGNPFYANGKWTSTEGGEGKRRKLSRNKISLRTRNFNSDRIKVNDLRGNPIEIAAVVVWRVRDTAQAMFDVDDYAEYVHIQSESALRHIASRYPYDHGTEDGKGEVTLRSDIEEVSHALQEELKERLATAGVEVEEARLTHLAYAPEIAGAMLRRQQAEAIIAARRKIVDGAVGMVDMALHGLSEKGVMGLDDERHAAMVSNLMVVLCSESEVQPIVNAGTLYS